MIGSICIEKCGDGSSSSEAHEGGWEGPGKDGLETKGCEQSLL